MATIEDLIALQGKQINVAKPLNPVRKQYASNTNNSQKTLIASIDKLTQQMNNLNSGVKSSSFDLNKAFSLASWVSQVVIDITKARLAEELGVTTTTDNQSNQAGTSNSTPLTNKILKSANAVLLNIITLQQQIDSQILSLEDQVDSIIDKINTNTTIKLGDGTIVQVPIANQQTIAALQNIESVTKSLLDKTNKVTTRLSNDKPITNFNDFVNNLSLKQVVEFAQLVISALILVKSIQNKTKKAKAIIIQVETAVPASNYINTGQAVSDLLTKSESEQNQVNDLNKAYEQITVLKDNIIFFGKINTSQQQNLNDIINKVDTFISQQQNNTTLQDLKTKLTLSL
jgi:nitrogen regulatory protein PII